VPTEVHTRRRRSFVDSIPAGELQIGTSGDLLTPNRLARRLGPLKVKPPGKAGGFWERGHTWLREAA
jgi:hypothetical protein